MIRDSKTRDEARAKIKAYSFSLEAVEALGIFIRGQESLKVEPGRYVLTDKQVDHILELRLYQLVGLERDKIKADYDALLDTIKDLLDILAREERVLQIIKDELQEVKAKHGTPRRTDFGAAEEGEIANVDLIANDSNIITITHRGYIKRTPAIEFRTQARGGKGLKGMEVREAPDKDDENDFVEHLFAATAHDYLMFFTDTGRVYVERVYQIPEGSRISKGRSIKNLLNLRPEEKIASVLRIEAQGREDKDATFVDTLFVLFATHSGKVKKTKLSDFRNYRKDGIIAIRIEEGNSLTHVVLTDGNNDISMVTNRGYAVRCNENTIRPMGRGSAGVRGIRPRPGDYLVGLTVVDDSKHFLVVSERGLGKRTPFGDYPTKGRGGKGVITMRVTEKTGLVTAGLRVGDGDDIMLMTNTGQSVRIRVSDIRITGRNASGVKLMNLKEGETIQDLALVVRDGDEEDDIEVAALPETDPSEIEEEIIDDLEEDDDDDDLGDDEGDEEEEK
jgi:DNA gyrase subunit A